VFLSVHRPGVPKCSSTWVFLSVVGVPVYSWLFRDFVILSVPPVPGYSWVFLDVGVPVYSIYTSGASACQRSLHDCSVYSVRRSFPRRLFHIKATPAAHQLPVTRHQAKHQDIIAQTLLCDTTKQINKINRKMSRVSSTSQSRDPTGYNKSFDKRFFKSIYVVT